MGAPKQGLCLKCRVPLLTEQVEGRQMPFCSECFKMLEGKMRAAMQAAGKPVKGKRLLTPRV